MILPKSGGSYAKIRAGDRHARHRPVPVPPRGRPPRPGSTAAAAGDTGLRWSQTDHIAGRTTTYCYDDDNRLTRASTSNGGDTWTYQYDANGNRTRTTKNGTEVQTQTVNSANQLTNSGWTYDGAGNLTRDGDTGKPLSYNGSNQLSSAGYVSSYVFAGSNQNELISQTVPGGASFTYTYGRTDRNDLPLIESITSGGGNNYLWHDDGGSPLAIRTYNGGVKYMALDGLGSPVALIGVTGTHEATYSYDPYGAVTVSNLSSNAASGLNPYRFAGGVFDRSTGYLKFGQRFYDTNTGRFTQQDSLETMAHPTRANRYQ